jgi:predicted CoA-substrate-specific enzyme activase
LHCYLGVDIGSVSSNLVLLDEDGRLVKKVYLRTRGNPIKAIKEGYQEIMENTESIRIVGVGTTGSGRYLAAVILGADIVKNEITAHAVATSYYYPEVRTIIEIGGQDSKIIILRNGIVYDFAMNTVCAAGTGSFLDQQASRLNIAIEDFGQKAIESDQPVRIAGRCGVFAESDMIHKQQMGYPEKDILMGLCEALVRNYLSNVGKGKKIEEPIIFQGGVAAASMLWMGIDSGRQIRQPISLSRLIIFMLTVSSYNEYPCPKTPRLSWRAFPISTRCPSQTLIASFNV